MVVVLAGRRIDADDAQAKRFPLENVDKVRQKIHQSFLIKKPDWLVCSGACGADLIALDVAGKLNIKRKMVLSFEPDIFRASSVIDRPGNWGELFDAVYSDLNKENNVVILNYSEDDKDAYEKTNFEILKKAQTIFKEMKQQSKQSFNSDIKKNVAVIVWEGYPKDSNDTTDHFRREAMRRGYEVEEINCLN